MLALLVEDRLIPEQTLGSVQAACRLVSTGCGIVFLLSTGELAGDLRSAGYIAQDFSATRDAVPAKNGQLLKRMPRVTLPMICNAALVRMVESDRAGS